MDGASPRLFVRCLGVENRYHISDLHATILRLMGFDHRRLTFFYNGLDQRLTGVEERKLIHQALA